MGRPKKEPFTPAPKVITFINHKGGVGKTTSAFNVAAGLAKLRARILAIDLDPQENLTYCFRNSISADNQETIYNFIQNGVITPQGIEKRIDLIAGDKRLMNTPPAEIKNLARLRDSLYPIKDNYDCILIDTPPSIGDITFNAIAASNYVYIPLSAESLPLKGLQEILEIITNLKPKLNPFLDFGGIFLTQFAGRRINIAIGQRIRELYGDLLMDTRIRPNIKIAESPLRGMDIYRYAPTSNGAIDYMNLTLEIIKRSNILRRDDR